MITSAELRLISKHFDAKATKLRDRAINAVTESQLGIVAKEETDRWAVAFSSAYQTTKAISEALSSAADELDGLT